MGKVKRFDGRDGVVFKSDDGMVVKYSDYAALEAKLAALVEAAESVTTYMGVTFCYDGDWTPLMIAEFDKLKATIAAAKDRRRHGTGE